MDNSGKDIRIALVGCGAIAQFHAQATAAVRGARCVAVYDIDKQRAESFRQTFCPEAKAVSTLQDAADAADAAIVAVPNAQHAPVSIALLRTGVHVLCEKPLAISTSQAREMTAAAEENQMLLVCGLVRRFFASTELVTQTLRREILGRPREFEVRESVWNWPMSRGVFERSTAGGGVLIDFGPHVFDLLNSWFGPLEVVEYRDDAAGGVEAFAFAQLRSQTVTGSVHLTRSYGTINRTRIKCERGYIDYDPHTRHQIAIVHNTGSDPELRTLATVATPRNEFVKQLENFVGAIRGEVEPRVSAATALSSLALIEDCYADRRPLIGGWNNEERDRVEPAVPFKKILVTGATGSVGSRLVEMWANSGRLNQLRCLVRSYTSAARIMRFPIEVAEADLLDRTAVIRAAEGCDAIIHLAAGDEARRETESVLAAARAHGIKRFVHMSSAAVYGVRMPFAIEALQEQTRVTKTNEPYADEKAGAERAVVRAGERGLQAIILRPHMVYGPGLRWSAELMELLARGEVCVIDDGGWCNLIYVDDLVRAIVAGLHADRGFGEPMFITDGVPLKWKDYIEAYAEFGSYKPPHVLSHEVVKENLGMREWLRQSVAPLPAVLRTQEFRRLVFDSPAVQATIFPLYLRARGSRRLQPLLERVRGQTRAVEAGRTFHPLWTLLQLSEARLSNDKARTLIGFQPQITFAEGLRLSSLWFERFGLLPNTEHDSRAQFSVA